MIKRLALIIAVLLLFCALAGAEEAPYNKDSLQSVLSYIRNEKPDSLALGQTKLSLQELRQVKDALPERADFTFAFYLSKVWVNSSETLVDLDQEKGNVTGQDLKDIIYLMPQVKRINVFKHSNLNNKVMCPIVDEYPDVFFGWTVRFGRDGKKYTVRSDATAFSTAKVV